MQQNYYHHDKTYIAKSLKFAERSMIWNRLFTFRDDLLARTQSLVFQFTINHIHTYKGPIKISEKRFLHLICIFLNVRNLKWVQCNCKNWNQWSYFLEKSFLFTIHQQWNECVSCILFKTCQFLWSYFDKIIFINFS